MCGLMLLCNGYYFLTGTSPQSLMNDISDVESNISANEYVKVLHDGIVNVLNECSITFHKRFFTKVNNSLQ